MGLTFDHIFIRRLYFIQLVMQHINTHFCDKYSQMDISVETQRDSVHTNKLLKV